MVSKDWVKDSPAFIRAESCLMATAFFFFEIPSKKDKKGIFSKGFSVLAVIFFISIGKSFFVISTRAAEFSLVDSISPIRVSPVLFFAL